MAQQISGISSYREQSVGVISSSFTSDVVSRSQNITQKEEKSNQTKKAGESVRITISDEALRRAGLAQEPTDEKSVQGNQDESGLSDGELKEVAELKSRDREVRAHEMAHVAAGGSLVRKGASFEYELGPDGVRYAVGGEVSIDTSPVQDDPAATIRKMQQVKRAALAPAQPSSQDLSVAASAGQKEAAARQDLNQKTAEELLK